MIGNDVIDLELAANSRWQEDRFQKKVFSASEREIIFFSENVAICFWRLWSMKEAAYKAHQQRFGLKRKFNPQEFNCRLQDAQNGLVEILGTKYRTQTEQREKGLYTVAFSGFSEDFFQQEFSCKTSVQFEVLKYIGKSKNLQLKYLELRKDENFVPYISFKNKKVPFLISLSHHGNYSAFLVQG